jgi:hypothetical protein
LPYANGDRFESARPYREPDMQNVNDIFADFAAAFVGRLRGDGDIVHPERLNRDQLDYSLASLQLVDEYLDHLHANHPEQLGPAWINAVLWGGAYVSEVIRRNAPSQYDWVDYDDFVREHPHIARLFGEQKQLANCAVLTPGSSTCTLPVNKVLRYIHDGAEHSVHYYASVQVRD